MPSSTQRVVLGGWAVDRLVVTVSKLLYYYYPVNQDTIGRITKRGDGLPVFRKGNSRQKRSQIGSKKRKETPQGKSHDNDQAPRCRGSARYNITKRERLLHNTVAVIATCSTSCLATSGGAPHL